MPFPYIASYCRFSSVSPVTWPSSEPVATHESACGISIEKLGVWSLSVKPPTWNSDIEHGPHVSHCASAAEIFIGCSSVTRIPKWLPNQRFTHATGTSTISASFAAGRNSSTLRPRRKCQQQMPNTTADARGEPGHDRVPERVQRPVAREQRPHARQLRLRRSTIL